MKGRGLVWRTKNAGPTPLWDDCLDKDLSVCFSTQQLVGIGQRKQPRKGGQRGVRH